MCAIEVVARRSHSICNVSVFFSALQGKVLMLITNSDYHYTNKMMSFAYNRFMPPGSTWRDLFDMVGHFYNHITNVLHDCISSASKVLMLLCCLCVNFGRKSNKVSISSKPCTSIPCHATGVCCLVILFPVASNHDQHAITMFHTGHEITHHFACIKPLQLSMSMGTPHIKPCRGVCTPSTSHECCHQECCNHKSTSAGDCASTQAGVLQQQDEPVRGGHRGWLDAASHGCQERWQPLLWGRGCHGRESPWAEWG